MSLAPRGVVEFVPKADPMVQRMLAVREDVFHDYTEQAFLAYLKRLQVQQTRRLKTGGRLLIAYQRHT